MNIQEANFQDLVTSYFDSPPAKEAANYLLDAIRAKRFDELAESLRRDRERGQEIGSAQEIARRAKVDSLLIGYSVLEIATMAGFIVPPDGSRFWRDAETILENPQVRWYDATHYPLRLSQLLAQRIQGQHRAIEKDPSSVVESFLRFLELDRRFINTLMGGYLLRMLEFSSVNGCWFDDVVKLIQRPEEFVRRILVSPNKRDVPDQVLYELGLFMQFCFDLRRILNQLQGHDLLQSEVWSHYSYWFGIIGENLDGRLGVALDQFLQWQPRTNDPKAAIEIREYVRDAREVIKDLTVRAYALPFNARWGGPMLVRHLLDSKGGRTVTIDRDATVSNAVAMLVQNNIGSLPVVDGSGRLVGILSERDVLRVFHNRSEGSGRLRIADLMNRDPVTCNLEDGIYDVMRKISARSIATLPILSEGQLVGVVSMGDVVRALHDEGRAENQLWKHIHGAVRDDVGAADWGGVWRSDDERR